jgi:hypothetical protein
MNMAVSWKKQTVDRTANMTSMELARHERKQRENRQKAIEDTERRAADLFKQVCRVLKHKRPEPDNAVNPDPYQVSYREREVRRWEFECLAVIRLAYADMRASAFTRKYNWNPDWKECGCLMMGRVLQQADKPEVETLVGSQFAKAVGGYRLSGDLKFVPMR